ncbi:hypothetical protein [Pseudomonas rhodesiae]|uniref:hypothetical protein n=1 Tax=Pseudomonas rhodesiae TaxID=76760 RepID=UPI0028A10110|nr:hypothetical protein [Pseudomonas rhodesiae]
MLKRMTFVAVLIALSSTVSASDDLPQLSDGIITIRKTENGVIVDAFRRLNGSDQRDTTGPITGVPPSGFGTFRLRFKDCGVIEFMQVETGVVEGLEIGRGRTKQCQVTNWDKRWRVAHEDA